MLPSSSTLLLALNMVLLLVDSTTALLPWTNRNQELQAQASTSSVVEPGVAFFDNLQPAFNLIDNLRNIPSCQRSASKKLMNFCYAYNGAGVSEATDVVLRRERGLFTIRMTQCHLDDALQDAKPECQPLLEEEVDTATMEPQMKACKSAMIKDHSAWTSHESINAHGLTLCQAMRGETEKAEQLEFQRTLLSTVRDVFRSMDQHKANFKDFREQFAHHGTAMKDLHEKQRKESEAIMDSVNVNLGDLKKEVSLMGVDVETMRQNTDQGLRDIFDNIKQFDQAVDLVKERLRSYESQMGSQFQTGLVELGDSLEVARSKAQYDLEMLLTAQHQHVYAMTEDLEHANRRTGALLGHLSAVDSGLASSAEKIKGLDNGLEVTAQKQHRINQHFHDMQSTADATLENLEALNQQTGKWLNTVSNLVTWLKSILESSVYVCRIFFTNFILAFLICFCWILSGRSLMTRVVMSVGLSCLAMLYLPDPFALIGNMISRDSSWPAHILELDSFAIGGVAGALVGALTTYLIQKHRRPLYDPTAPLSSYAWSDQTWKPQHGIRFG